jgi:hypothetical protein
VNGKLQKKKMKSISRIIRDLERINKIKADLRKGNELYYDEGIKPENRCRDGEYANSS